MEAVNHRNNQPQLFPGGEETLAALVAVCREKMWPLLKNSTHGSYDFYLDSYILPKWGSKKLTKLRTIELQDFFNSFSPRLASKTIRNMHACLRAMLNQGKAWELVRSNPAQGVRLPRKKARKPPVVLAKQDIRRVIDDLPEPTKSTSASLSPARPSALKRSTTVSGWSALWSTISAISIWGKKLCSPCRTPSGQKCNLCLRNVLLPMSPERTICVWRDRMDLNGRTVSRLLTVSMTLTRSGRLY